MRDRMPESVPCNLCGSTVVRRLYTSRDYRLQVDDTEWSVVRCVRCGLGFLNPRPTREEAGRYYPSWYFSKRKGDMGRYRRLAEYVPAGSGRLLDVGTADGHFLELMRERGWTVAGVEPGGSRPESDDRGLDIHYVPFPEGAGVLESASFDVITAWAVFEHLHDPKGAFRECARLLKPGGKLVIQVPNLDSPVSRLPIKEDVPRHLYMYTPATLRKLGATASLKLDRVHHTPHLFGGHGRGGAQYGVSRIAGQSLDEYFEMLHLTRPERFRRRPGLTAAWVAAAAAERVVLSSALVRALRMGNQIVCQFRLA
jgi:2-polyprenyl-3-methyl-5-hydroxy-6-metoxy-1,4-benzoquinol methylase